MAEKNMNAKISVEFEETANRQQLSSGDNLPTLFGKIKKFFIDLKTVAFSGSYNDLSDTPTTATIDTDGLMSAEDKTKLDNADDTYALKSKYGDTTINVGRKTDTDVGVYSTAEGYVTTASGDYSHAEGYITTVSGKYSHAEGYITTASGNYSHAEGYYTTASGNPSHAEGHNTTASGNFSHAEGNGTIASGQYSHAEGYYTKALHLHEVACGSYNISGADILFSIGDGTAEDARHNAFEITATGGKLHDKNIVTDDMSLPASGGNADTVDGLHAASFLQNVVPVSLTTSINDMTTAGTYGVYNETPDLPTGYGHWGFLEVRRYGVLCYQTIIFENGVILTRGRDITDEGWAEWQKLSTLKSAHIGGTTNTYGNFSLWKASDRKKPIFVEINGYYAYPFLILDGNDNYYYAGLIDAATHESVTNTAVSGTVYYIEI